MKIMTINIDSEKMPNIVLEKVKMYYREKGYEIIEDFPLLANSVDKIYVSVIFDWNKAKAEEWENFNAEIGGSGYDLHKELPPEIDKMKPKVNYGFTTRGCIRKCPFCIVPIKEGKLRAVGDIYDFWDGKTKDIILFDNNILGLPEHFKMICKQVQKENLIVDFNQGLDCRLLTEELAETIKRTRTSEIRFAFDHPRVKKAVEKTIDMFDGQTLMWYVLVGFDTTPREDIDRLEYLRSRNQKPYVQRYNFADSTQFYKAVAGWANARVFWFSLSWNEYLDNLDKNKYYKDIIRKELAENKRPNYDNND